MSNRHGSYHPIYFSNGDSYITVVSSRGVDDNQVERGVIDYKGHTYTVRLDVSKGSWIQEGEPWPEHGFFHKDIQ